METSIFLVYKKPTTTLKYYGIDTLFGKYNQHIIAGDLNSKTNNWNS